MNHVRKNYSFENFQKMWVEFIDDVCETEGSWETRTKKAFWELKEIA